MPRRPSLKSSKRFVMYIPNVLREEIETWVKRRGITLAEFGRAAFENYLHHQKQEERDAQLAETCRLFENKSDDFLTEWTTAGSERSGGLS